MSTFRELIVMVADLAKQVSDDETLTRNHIAFLLKKYRTYLLKQKYINASQEIPASNYQTVCVNLEEVDYNTKCPYSECRDGGDINLLRSVTEVGEPVSFGDAKISVFRCPGEYSLTLKIKDSVFPESKVKWLNEFFSKDIIPLYSDSYEFQDDGRYLYTYNLYESTEDQEGIEIEIYYNKEKNEYTISSDIPLWYLTDNSDEDSYFYLTGCSEDVETVIDLLLTREGIKAEFHGEKTPQTSCNEETFYTSAVLKHGDIRAVSKEEFPYSGYSRYGGNRLYGTIGIDNHIYIKSKKSLYFYDRAIVTAVFEDPEDAYNKSGCTYTDEGGNISKCPEGGSCDPWDMTFPMEDALQPALINMTLKDILGAAYRPIDGINNSSDDLAEIVNYVRQNMKQQYVKQQEPSDVE